MRIVQCSLVVHVLGSVGWLGAALCFAAIAVRAQAAAPPAQQGLDEAMLQMLSWVIVPLALFSLGSGVVQSLVSRWGLARHYWVIVKEVVTALAVLILLIQWRGALPLADAGRLGGSAVRQGLLLHSVLGTAVLLLPLVLSVIKPRGVTRRGRRAQAIAS